MSDNPDGLESALEALFRWWNIPVTPETEEEPKIKKEVVPESEIRQLLQELQTPEVEVEKTVKKIHSILELTEEDLENGTYPEIRRMAALTEERAKFLPRFEAIPMVYRDYVGLHSQRINFVIWLNRPLFKEIFGEEFNDHYATLYASVHDILEWISPFWDIPTPIKMGLSKRSNEIMNIIERKLWEILIRSWPLVHPEYEYDRAMLEDMISKKTLESQVVSYFDKLDGFLTCYHEIIAGNTELREPFHNYINFFKDVRDRNKLPTLQAYLQWEWDTDKWDLALFNQIDDLIAQWDRIEDIFWSCTTTESMKENIDNDFWFAMYGAWKRLATLIPTYDARGIYSAEELLTRRGRVLVPPHWLYEK